MITMEGSNVFPTGPIEASPTYVAMDLRPTLLHNLVHLPIRSWSLRSMQYRAGQC